MGHYVHFAWGTATRGASSGLLGAWEVSGGALGGSRGSVGALWERSGGTFGALGTPKEPPKCSRGGPKGAQSANNPIFRIG